MQPTALRRTSIKYRGAVNYSVFFKATCIMQTESTAVVSYEMSCTMLYRIVEIVFSRQNYEISTKF
jgi:hypothetical protein